MIAGSEHACRVDSHGISSISACLYLCTEECSLKRSKFLKSKIPQVLLYPLVCVSVCTGECSLNQNTFFEVKILQVNLCYYVSNYFLLTALFIKHDFVSHWHGSWMQQKEIPTPTEVEQAITQGFLKVPLSLFTNITTWFAWSSQWFITLRILTVSGLSWPSCISCTTSFVIHNIRILKPRGILFNFGPDWIVCILHYFSIRKQQIPTCPLICVFLTSLTRRMQSGRSGSNWWLSEGPHMCKRCASSVSSLLVFHFAVQFKRWKNVELIVSSLMAECKPTKIMRDLQALLEVYSRLSFCCFPALFCRWRKLGPNDSSQSGSGHQTTSHTAPRYVFHAQ